MNHARIKLGAAFLILLTGGGMFFAPARAEAQVAAASCLPLGSILGSIIPTGLPVKDVANFTVNSISAVSNCTLSGAYQDRKGPLGSGIGLDTLGWTIGKIAIQMMTKSVVNWINSGFNGSPAFITNFSGFLTQVADVAAGTVIKGLSTNAGLKSPFQSQVAQNTARAYSLSSSPGGFFASIKYTLGLVPGINDSAFLAGNFSQGGWAAFYSASQHPQNNPIGAQMIAVAQVKAQVAAAQGQQTTQLGWGQGFLSWCGDATGGGGGANAGGACHTDNDCAGALACVDAPEGHCAVDNSLEGNTATTCTNKDGSTGSIKTPGSVIQAQVNKTLGLQGDTLVTADEFNEVIGALMSQLVSQVLGGVGLLGTASVSSGGTGYIDQATNPAQTTQAVADSSTNGTLTTSINAETQSLQQYQGDWQAILTEAQTAKAALAQCSSGDSSDETAVDAVIAQAQAAIAKGTAAQAALQKISNDATSAVTMNGAGLSVQSTGIQSITNVTIEFQSFLASPLTPSATDISYAHTQAQDNSADDTKDVTLTLFAQMAKIAAKNLCPSTGS